MNEENEKGLDKERRNDKIAKRNDENKLKPIGLYSYSHWNLYKTLVRVDT